MVRGIEAAAKGMANIVNWNDVIANNLANVNTPGFKQTLVSFKNIMDVQVNNPYPNTPGVLGNISAGSAIDASVIDFKQGSIKTTGNPLDLALNGDGFFVIQTPQGQAYTRNGSFIINNNNEISTIDGYPVLGETGAPITLNFNAKDDVKDIKIDAQGNVELNKVIIDKIKVVDFENRNSLQAMGGSLYKTSGNTPALTPEKYSISQGALEGANSNVIECMINSINGSRTYEHLSKVIETDNRTLSKVVSEVGRVRR